MFDLFLLGLFPAMPRPHYFSRFSTDAPRTSALKPSTHFAQAFVFFFFFNSSFLLPPLSSDVPSVCVDVCVHDQGFHFLPDSEQHRVKVAAAPP